ncbi:amino acid ABC transporter permease [Kurthia sibirica]|uniref:Amino acid ABC transporter permease n=1 Tax=Kurthia sibirica TaxID=202750 RepID=A0A2U3AJJ5_9BACL|nr:amino acid ABC transporter permease [Kurthia sibirica]PWI24733.1 amino acid ABC transporter permease [Kurthia sibirica]GEK34763.1 amino acid ABC transporter permease [Kurthia sibirica]
MDQYIDANYFWQAVPQILPFLKVTFFVVGLSIFFGTMLSIVLVAMKLSKKKYLTRIANGYTTIMRCTPSIVLLFLIYYGIPALAAVVHIDLQNMHSAVFVIITFTMQFTAMMSEIIRASYLAVDKGQFEAAVSVGLTPFQAYRRIIAPQAFVIAIPNIGNGVINLLQEGSLAYTIGLIDIVGKANLIIAGNMNTHALEVFIALALIYWILSIIIEHIFARLERFFSKGKKSLGTQYKPRGTT